MVRIRGIKRGKVEGRVEETDGMRKERFEDAEVNPSAITTDLSSFVWVLINEKEIKTERFLYSLS